MTTYGRRIAAALGVALLLAAAAPATASVWAGHNGVIRLSFTPADSMTSVATVEAGTPAGTVIDLYAVMTDVDLVHWNSGQVIAMGGFELKLAWEGANVKVLGVEFEQKCFNVGKEKAQCLVGFYPDLSLREGPAVLAHWQLLVMGEASNVVFRLDKAGVVSSRGLEGCEDSGSYALWAGSKVSEQAGLLFSAGYVPAYLNWEGEPDLSVIKGTGDWPEIGLVELKE